jgi:GT2 family glycosyltransferase
MKSKISVIICTRNRFEDFQMTLSSLMLQNRLPDELVVIDSSDAIDLDGYLKSADLPVAVKYIHSKPGLTLQRNIGIRNSEGDLLFFFDDDMEFDANYLVRVEAVFARDIQGEIGAVGGRISNLFDNQPMTFRYQIERLIFSLIRFIFGLDGFGSGRFRFSGMPTYSPALEGGKYIECLSGGLMAFRREVFDKIKFDESLPNYGLMEDVDISKQTLDAGYKIYYETSATLLHNESPRNRLNQYGMAEMTVVNYTYLFHKNWNKNGLRKIAFFWALLGLIVVNLTKKEGLRGTLSGIAKLKQR